ALSSVGEDGTLIDFGDGNSLLLQDYFGLSPDDIVMEPSGQAMQEMAAMSAIAADMMVGGFWTPSMSMETFLHEVIA
ncbi:MAG: hypothetical protein AAGD40_08900, partial [Pseudomonadota bacterium]